MFRHVDIRHDAALLVHEERLAKTMAHNAARRAIAESAGVNNTRPARQPKPHRALPQPARALHAHRRLAHLPR